jgi:hypothetical protein
VTENTQTLVAVRAQSTGLTVRFLKTPDTTIGSRLTIGTERWTQVMSGSDGPVDSLLVDGYYGCEGFQ